MTRVVLSVALTGTLAFTLPAHAAGSLTRTFVSSAGNDANPCTVTQPCATFATAYAATAANGIIAALDPGKYGPLTITGPVTVDGNGWAAITAASNNAGINVNAGASDNVVLRGLIVDGGNSTNAFGIRFNAGLSLTVEGCTVRNVHFPGLEFQSTVTTAQTLAVSDSSFIGSANAGIEIKALSSGTITASIDRTAVVVNATGLAVNAVNSTGAVNVAVTDSVATGNTGTGFFATSDAGQAAANLALTRVQSAVNGTGVQALGTNATVILAQSTISGNSTGTSLSSGGVIDTFGDNYINFNSGNVGSLTPVTKQ